MKVFLGICLEDYAPAPDVDPSFVLKRGTEYTISAKKNGTVMVFSRYWVKIPAELFGGILTLDRSPVK